MASKVAFQKMTTFPVLVAHRGASLDAPENTMASFELAWKNGAGRVEGDFWLTADKRIVCIHDPTTERTAPAQPVLDVREVNCSDLDGYDVGSWKGVEFSGIRIPLLDEILSRMPEGGQIYIEIKQKSTEIITVLLETIEASPVDLSQVILISFTSEIVKLSKQLAPDLKAFLLYDPDGDEVEDAELLTTEELIALAHDIRADGVDLGNSERIDAVYAKKIRDAGLELHVWTVNTLDDALRFAGLGFQSITTDRPHDLRDEIEAYLSLPK